MSEPRSILIVRLTALGDVIHVLPSLAALRRAMPDAKIGWLIEDRAAPLLEGHPDIDRLHVMRRHEWVSSLKRWKPAPAIAGFRALLQEIRAERYDVAIDFQANMRSGLSTYLTRIPRRIGQPPPFAKEQSGWFYTDVPAAVAPERHKIERNLQLLGPLGVATDPTPRSRLPDFPSEPELPTKGDRAWVVVHPGVSPAGAVKAWRAERFAELGRRLVADGHEVFFSWAGSAEQALARQLAADAPGSRVGPSTDLARLARFLERADLFIGVDSGPLHLAAALGTPVVGLYGPKHTGTYGPFWPGGASVVADYPCSPCRFRRCPRPEASSVVLPDGSSLRISPCMDTIDAAEVHAEARRRLATSEA